MEIPQPFHWEVWFILIKINLLLANMLLNSDQKLLSNATFRNEYCISYFWAKLGLGTHLGKHLDSLLGTEMTGRDRLTHILFLCLRELNLPLLLLRTLTTKLISGENLVFFSFWWIDYNKFLFTFFLVELSCVTNYKTRSFLTFTEDTQLHCAVLQMHLPLFKMRNEQI